MTKWLLLSCVRSARLQINSSKCKWKLICMLEYLFSEDYLWHRLYTMGELLVVKGKVCLRVHRKFHRRSLAYSLTRQRPIRDLTCTSVYNIHRHSHRENDTWRILPSQVDSILNVSLYWTTFLLTNISLALTKLKFIIMGRIIVHTFDHNLYPFFLKIKWLLNHNRRINCIILRW